MKEFFILQSQVSNALFYYLKKMSSYLSKIWIRIRINVKSEIRIRPDLPGSATLGGRFPLCNTVYKNCARHKY